MIGVSAPTMAYAYYNGYNAAQYAADYGWSANYNYPGPWDEDCTNFASQALHEGGYPLTDFGDYSPYAWWYNARWYGGWDWSLSWSMANDLRNFLLWTSPGGWDYGIQCDNGSCQYDYINLADPGDILFYDWGGGLGWSHAAVETAWQGNEESGAYWPGDLVAQHTAPHSYAMWTLWNYNASRWTTSIDVVHIEDNVAYNKNTLWGVYGQYLLPGQYLESTYGTFKFIYQTDGNLVLYENGVPLWNTATITSPGYAIMQTDGNFVLYWPNGTPYWATNTWGNPGSYLTVQDDGNVVVYRNWQNLNPLWWTGT